MPAPTLPPPALTPDTALFLDFDGTLVELAPSPDAVRVPLGLVPTLAALYEQLGGALAIVTGRPLAAVDHFLAPLALPAAAEHGAHCRLLDGAEPAAPAPDLAPAVAILAALAARHPGLLVERKAHSVALHYRHAPALEADCLAAATAAAASTPGMELLAGKFVYEIKLAGVSKGAAIARLMREPPFAGRVPVFAGDDVTDESAIAAVQALGGAGIKVGPGPSAATARCASPAALRAWLVANRDALADAMVPSPQPDDEPAR